MCLCRSDLLSEAPIQRGGTVLTAASPGAAPGCSQSATGAAGAKWRATSSRRPASSLCQAKTVVVDFSFAAGTRRPPPTAPESCCSDLKPRARLTCSAGGLPRVRLLLSASGGSAGTARGCLNCRRAGAYSPTPRPPDSRSKSSESCSASVCSVLGGSSARCA